MWALGVLLHELFSGQLPLLPPADSTKKGHARRVELYETILKKEPTFDAPVRGGPTQTEGRVHGRCVRLSTCVPLRPVGSPCNTPGFCGPRRRR